MWIASWSSAAQKHLLPESVLPHIRAKLDGSGNDISLLRGMHHHTDSLLNGEDRIPVRFDFESKTCAHARDRYHLAIRSRVAVP